ncbi:NUDIX hydrolase [soil metagenome]
MVIPADRLPPGFAESVARAPTAGAPTRPAATAVLLRDGTAGPELLLLRRLRSAGFVPGAWVFPGGVVDDDDADAELVSRLGETPRGPGPAYWLAAIREVFEETGVLFARAGDASDARVGDVGAAGAVSGEELTRWRDALLAGDATLLQVVHSLDLLPDISRMVYCSHWITPVAEPRRYDTRFFLAELPAGAVTSIDEREMSDALWIAPGKALAAFRRGELPMIFPTVKTIQMLMPYDSVDAMLSAFRGLDVPPILPRLVRTKEGVGIVMPRQEHDDA